MKCPTCEFENPEAAKFCCRCGVAIADPLAIERVRASVQRQIDDFVEERQRELRIAEREALDRIQEAAVKRAKTFLLLLGVPLAVLAGALTIFGITSWADLRSKLQESSDLVAEMAPGLATVQAAAENSQEVLDQLKKADQLRISLETALDSATASLDKLQHFTTRSINARYKISLHVPLGGIEVESFLQRLREVLGAKGFVVKAEDTLRVGANQTEILYYDDGDRERAEMIRNALQEAGVLKVTTPKKVGVTSRNYEIQIKVHQIPVAGGADQE